jgi:sulfoquinovosidase
VTARFEAKEGGFDLLLGDRVILRHRIDAPAFRIAKGNPTVTMVRGNFRHEDAPEDERVLGDVRFERYADVTKISFDSPEQSGPLLVVEVSSDGRFWATAGEGYNRISISFVLESGEVLWGAGEQMSYLALNGRRFPIWTSEPGVGREPGTWLTDKVSADGSLAGITGPPTASSLRFCLLEDTLYLSTRAVIPKLIAKIRMLLSSTFGQAQQIFR